MRYTALFVIAALAMIATRADAAPPHPLGWYVGASVGHAELRSTVRATPTYPFDESDTGWKVLLGLRPYHVFAAELGYVDFGHPNGTTNLDFPFAARTDVHQRALALSGLFYLPIPLPRLDVYARIGLARLKTNGTSLVYCRPGPGHVCPLIVAFPHDFSSTNVDVLYGAGLQVTLSPLAVRLEYERIDDRRGDPQMLSVGVTLGF